MRPVRLGALLSFCLLLLGGSVARAQFDTASVVGTVRDQSGAPIPGAKVTLTNTATSVSASRTTGTDGNYEFVTVKPGIYVVTAEMTGFAMALTDNVQVQVGGRMRVDMQLALGQIREQIEVTAASPLIETDSSSARPGDHGRADARTAVERPRVFVARAALNRRPAVGAQQEHQRHPARGRVQRERPAEHVPSARSPRPSTRGKYSS